MVEDNSSLFILILFNSNIPNQVYKLKNIFKILNAVLNLKLILHYMKKKILYKNHFI